jgi:hypothetical protein
MRQDRFRVDAAPQFAPVIATSVIAAMAIAFVDRNGNPPGGLIGKDTSRAL